MKENSLFLIDTNILVYAYEKEKDIKNKKAKELINKCWQNKINLIISNQNLAEFAFVATRKAKLDHTQIKVIINDIINFNGFKKINYSSNTILSALNISNEFQISFWDSLLIATMKENNIFSLYTENVKDFKIPWLKVINPLIQTKKLPINNSKAKESEI